MIKTVHPFLRQGLGAMLESKELGGQKREPKIQEGSSGRRWHRASALSRLDTPRQESILGSSGSPGRRNLVIEFFSDAFS